MNNKELEKEILRQNQEIIVSLSNQLGRYIQANDIQGFQILTKAISQIVDSRQQQLVNSMRDKETE
jgi:hypothetical protein